MAYADCYKIVNPSECPLMTNLINYIFKAYYSLVELICLTLYQYEITESNS